MAKKKREPVAIRVTYKPVLLGGKRYVVVYAQ